MRHPRHMGRIREGQEDAAFPVCRWRAYRAGVGVQAGLGALGVGHRARGEDERPPPRRRRGDGHPVAAPAVALRQRVVEADGVAGGGRGGRGMVARGDQGLGRQGRHGGHRHCSAKEVARRATNSPIGSRAPCGDESGVCGGGLGLGE
jgi:hypothetical protein